MSKTKMVKAEHLTGNEILISNSGNKAFVYSVTPSTSIPGLVVVETDFGALYIDANKKLLVEE
jgi:hypothetical protein